MSDRVPHLIEFNCFYILNGCNRFFILIQSLFTDSILMQFLSLFNYFYNLVDSHIVFLGFAYKANYWLAEMGTIATSEIV